LLPWRERLPSAGEDPKAAVLLPTSSRYQAAMNEDALAVPGPTYETRIWALTRQPMSFRSHSETSAKALIYNGVNETGNVGI
jgi:hypothetical protein